MVVIEDKGTQEEKSSEINVKTERSQFDDIQANDEDQDVQIEDVEVPQKIEEEEPI